MDRGQFLLQGVEGEVADQVDGAGKHQLQAVHDSQRRLDVWWVLDKNKINKDFETAIRMSTNYGDWLDMNCYHVELLKTRILVLDYISLMDQYCWQTSFILLSNRPKKLPF